MLKKVAIVEFYYHHTVVERLATLLTIAEVEVLLFTVEGVSELLSPSLRSKIQLIHYQPSQDKFSTFWKNQKQLLAGVNGIIITTIAAHFRSWSKVDWPSKTLVVIHNSNSFFKGKSHLLVLKKHNWMHPGLVLKTIYKTLIQKEIYWKQQLVEKIDFFTHYSADVTSLQSFIKAEFAGKVIDTMPLDYIKFQATKATKNHVFNIVVPGTISNKGRNYELILHLLERLDKQASQRKIKLVLAGKPASNAGALIIKRLQALKLRNIILEYFADTITNSAYQSILRHANLFLLPLAKATYFSIYEEVLGLTKASGTLADTINHQKLTLIPDFYPKPIFGEAFFISFKSDDLEDLLNKLIALLDENYYAKLSVNAQESMEIKSIEKAAEQLSSYLKTIFI